MTLTGLSSFCTVFVSSKRRTLLSAHKSAHRPGAALSIVAQKEPRILTIRRLSCFRLLQLRVSCQPFNREVQAVCDGHGAVSPDSALPLWRLEPAIGPVQPAEAALSYAASRSRMDIEPTPLPPRAAAKSSASWRIQSHTRPQNPRRFASASLSIQPEGVLRRMGLRLPPVPLFQSGCC